MKSGRKLRRTEGAGYTITEVMIVMAVTTVMFVATVTIFSGRQGRTEFTQAVRNFEAQLQTTISEVTNGVYASSNCRAIASGTPGVAFDSNVPGSCIFVGKGYTPLVSMVESDVSTLVGRRTIGAAANEVTTLSEAAPAVASTGTYTHSFQLQLRRIVRMGGDASTSYSSFAFIVPFAGSSNIETDQSAGSRQVTLFAVPLGGALPYPRGLVEVPQGIKLCLRGQNGQRAEITIGAEGSDSLLVSTLDTQNVGECFNV